MFSFHGFCSNSMNGRFCERDLESGLSAALPIRNGLVSDTGPVASGSWGSGKRCPAAGMRARTVPPQGTGRAEAQPPCAGRRLESHYAPPPAQLRAAWPLLSASSPVIFKSGVQKDLLTGVRTVLVSEHFSQLTFYMAIKLWPVHV